LISFERDCHRHWPAGNETSAAGGLSCCTLVSPRVSPYNLGLHFASANLLLAFSLDYSPIKKLPSFFFNENKKLLKHAATKFLFILF
jgi:hypothetical protein